MCIERDQEPGAELQHARVPRTHCGSVKIVTHVVFAPPQRLHQTAGDGTGDRRREADEIGIESAAEGTAHQHRVERDLFGLEPEGERGGLACHVRDLHTGPHGRAILVEFDRATKRLHGRMGEEWHLVICPQHRTGISDDGVDLADIVIRRDWRIVAQTREQLVIEVLLLERAGSTCHPLRIECSHGALCPPPLLGQHGDGRRRATPAAIFKTSTTPGTARAASSS